jgi:hypothetical protein
MLFACESVSDSNSAPLRQCRRNTGLREWRRQLSNLRIRPGLKAAASSLCRAGSRRRSRGRVRHPAGTAAAIG